MYRVDKSQPICAIKLNSVKMLNVISSRALKILFNGRSINVLSTPQVGGTVDLYKLLVTGRDEMELVTMLYSGPSF